MITQQTVYAPTVRPGPCAKMALFSFLLMSLTRTPASTWRRVTSHRAHEEMVTAEHLSGNLPAGNVLLRLMLQKLCTTCCEMLMEDTIFMTPGSYLYGQVKMTLICNLQTKHCNQTCMLKQRAESGTMFGGWIGQLQGNVFAVMLRMNLLSTVSCGELQLKRFSSPVQPQHQLTRARRARYHQTLNFLFLTI